MSDGSQPRGPFDALWSRLPRVMMVEASRALGRTGVLGLAGQLELGALRRVLWHAALVGVAAGLVGAAFFAAIEWTQHALLGSLAGYRPLSAHGEASHGLSPGAVFRPWLLVLIPVAGGLAAGLVMRLAPETRGGGGDALIAAFHHRSGMMRKRVAVVKFVASVLTLGSGGAGGREGPTMQIGGALGSLISGALRLTPRERRILLVAGAAAGISAVFRTPLGAAILAVEVLYREGFEADALIPSVLASVVAYSVVISISGESILFAHAPSYPFIPRHLPLDGSMAVVVAATASVFVASLGMSRRAFRSLPVPKWLRPACGGLALGLLAATSLGLAGDALGGTDGGLGALGGGYGAAQVAITGSPLLGEGWGAVRLLGLLAVLQIVAASFTIGSGGSAGDFAPSLVIGGLVGGAFGRAAALLLDDPSIDPGAFALVGMGAFYGGIAHVPLASLVLVCEMARSYDLLVPLMLAEAVAFIALRRRSLYDAQLPAMRDSLVHQQSMLSELLARFTIAELMSPNRGHVEFLPLTKGDEMIRRAALAAPQQDVFPVRKPNGKLEGIVTSEALRTLASDPDLQAWTVASDVMQRAVSVRAEDDAATAARKMLGAELRELPVVDAAGVVIGFIDEADIARIYLEGKPKAPEPDPDTTWSELTAGEDTKSERGEGR